MISPLLAADEAEEDQSRGPYEFQFRVDDPETYNKFEVENKHECIDIEMS